MKMIFQTTGLIATMAAGLLMGNLSAQTQSVRTTNFGNRQVHSLDMLRLQEELNALFLATGPSASDVSSAPNDLSWASVLEGGSTANMSISLGNHDLNAVGTATVDLLLADSLVVAKVIQGEVSSLSNHTADDLAEGGTHQFFTLTRSRNAITISDTGGDGSLTYDATTGAITYTGASAAEVRAHFSAGTGVTLTDGEIAVGQAVGSTDDVTFNSVTADLVGDVTGDVTGRVSSLANHTTDSLTEGAVNLYFTAEREATILGSLDSLQSLYDGLVGELARPNVTTDSMNVSAGSRVLYGHATALFGGIDSAGFVISTDSDFASGDTVWSAGVGPQGSYSADVTNWVSAGVENFYKAVAQNVHASSGGEVLSFMTFTCGSSNVTFGGHDYSTVQIGSQCWFAENLRTTIYTNGDPIPGNLTDSEWTSTTSGATTVYGEGTSTVYHGSDDEVANLENYGRLYNWYAVDDSRGLCPSGWHVPLDGEWTALTDYLGGSLVASTAMMSSAGDSPSWDGTNTSGFSALPGGARYYLDGSFNNGGDYGVWWSASPSGTSYAWGRLLLPTSDYNLVVRVENFLRNGFSVRCLRDE